MKKVKLRIHKLEEKDVPQLQKKLIGVGFKINTKFQTTIVPIQGTIIRKKYVGDFIVYYQEDF